MQQCNIAAIWKFVLISRIKLLHDGSITVSMAGTTNEGCVFSWLFMFENHAASRKIRLGLMVLADCSSPMLHSLYYHAYVHVALF